MPYSNCKYCNKEFKYTSSTTGTYCSMNCTFEAQRIERKQKFLEGKITTRGSIKNFLIEEFGYICSMCSNTEWLNKPIPLEVDHIDGNATNNYPDNVRLLCPNCHATTPTHKARNKGNGRKSRGLPYW